jgi:hypothetical protein
MKVPMLAVLLTAAALAQNPVCATGVIEPVTGPTICMQGETHLLAGTRLYLRSRAVDLNRYLGQLVRVEGPDIGVTCNILEVTAVTNPHAILNWCGTAMPGCPIKLQVGPGAIGRWALFGSFGPGYLPLGCGGIEWIDGTVFMLLPAVSLGGGMFPGPWGEIVLPIPPSMSLVGTRVWFQGARQDIGPVGPVQLTNVQLITITPFMPPCGSINC